MMVALLQVKETLSMTTADFEPTWVKTMANGQLGEARVRAILLERFHVMTRSVDMDGADFFVQSRSSGRFSDLLAPRIGVVQAKFAQDDKTTHLVPVSYSVDGGYPLKEFFVIISVGHEDNVRYYLLSAADLGTLPKKTVDGSEYYQLNAKKREPFLVKKVRTALDRIQQCLSERTSEQNERFLHSVHIPDFPVQRKALDPDWFWLVPNEHGFIPDIIWKLRIVLRSQLYALDDFAGGVANALKASDAKACLAAVDGILDGNEVRTDKTGAELVLDLSGAAATQNDLRLAIKKHLSRIRKLRRGGHWLRFRSLEAAILDSHVPFHDQHHVPKLVRAGKRTERLSDEHARTVVRLDPTTLDLLSVETMLVRKNSRIPTGPGVLSRSTGLWKHGFDEGATVWRELHRLRAQLMSDYFRLLVPKEPLGRLVFPVGLAE